MEQIDKLKALVTSIFSILTSLLGAHALPVILLVGCNILDYITAILEGPNRGQKIELVCAVCRRRFVPIGTKGTQ